MPRDLNKLLSNNPPTSKPEIRRGQGYKLSTELENAQVQQIDSALDINLENAQTSKEDEVQRTSRGIRLSDDLFFECKRIAVAQRRKLYEVIEQALEEYIARYTAEEKKR